MSTARSEEATDLSCNGEAYGGIKEMAMVQRLQKVGIPYFDFHFVVTWQGTSLQIEPLQWRCTGKRAHTVICTFYSLDEDNGLSPWSSVSKYAEFDGKALEIFLVWVDCHESTHVE